MTRPEIPPVSYYYCCGPTEVLCFRIRVCTSLALFSITPTVRHTRFLIREPMGASRLQTTLRLSLLFFWLYVSAALSNLLSVLSRARTFVKLPANIMAAMRGNMVKGLQVITGKFRFLIKFPSHCLSLLSASASG